MRRIFIVALLMALTLPLTTWAQSSMTDQQVVEFVIKESEKGTSQAEIVQKLMARGVDIQQIQRVRKKYDRQIKQGGMGAMADEAVSKTEDRMRKNNARQQTGMSGTSYRKRNSQVSRLTSQEKNRRNKNRKNRGDQSLYADENNYIFDDEDPDFLLMQAELGGIMPVDSIALLEQLLEERQREKKRIFGHDIFNNEDLSFEPNMNIATPRDYVLGPGDAVIIDIYGASQQTFDSTVSPDGEVTIEGYGPISVSGLTVDQANARLRSQLGQRYQNSKVRLTVGQTRTISVNVAGEVEMPGTYTLSAFATVFNALYAAGGVTDIGTLRNIKVYRNSRLISTVDVYDYILNGQSKSNVKLTDNDMIIVGAYDCLVSMEGRVKRPMYYEMKSTESLSSLVKYAGGFTGDAYRKSLRVIRKAGAQYSVHTVGEFDLNAFHMADGDSVIVDSIVKRYSNMVEVKGAVYHPGMYEVGRDITTVGQLIEAAEGVTEEAIVTRAVMHRMRKDRSLEVLAVDLEGILKGTAADVPLQNEDVLYVASSKDVDEDKTLTIYGEVLYPGVYRYAANETVEDLIIQAGGLNDAASLVKVDVARRIIDPNAETSSDSIAHTYSFSLRDGFVVKGEPGFHLQPYDEVYVRKSPQYSEQQKVKVQGEVLFEGTYTLSRRSERLSEIIKQAGGLTKTAYAKGARLIRQRTQEEFQAAEAMLKMAIRRRSFSKDTKDSIDVSQLQVDPTYTVGIELEKAMANPGSDADVVLREGDQIVVPEYSSTVKINGEVMHPNTVSYIDGKGVSYYINQAGGYGTMAKKNKTYIVYMNGNLAKASRKHRPAPGCEIIVPTRIRGNRLSMTEILSIGTSTASIATMLATFANLIK